MKIIADQSDILLVKSFLKQRQPNFVSELSLDLDVDYLAGLCMRFIDNDSKLTNKLVDFDLNRKMEINDNLNKAGNYDDKISYLRMRVAYLVLTKYYLEDGTVKDEFLK